MDSSWPSQKATPWQRDGSMVYRHIFTGPNLQWRSAIHIGKYTTIVIHLAKWSYNLNLICFVDFGGISCTFHHQFGRKKNCPDTWNQSVIAPTQVWWLNQPIWKIFAKLGSSSPGSGETKKYWKPPLSYLEDHPHQLGIQEPKKFTNLRDEHKTSLKLPPPPPNATNTPQNKALYPDSGMIHNHPP